LTGLPSAQGVKGNGAGIQVHLTAHQPMGPEGINRKGVAQQLHGAMPGRASQIDHVPTQGTIELPPPPLGKRAPGWGRLDASHGSPVVGGEVTGGPGLEVREGVVMETRPHLGLPLGIEPFDGGLKARLPRGSKDGHDLEGQTEPDDTSHGIGMLMVSLKAGIMIELGKRRQSPGAPMLQQGVHGRLGRDDGHRPGGHEPAVQSDAGEDLHVDPPFDDQAFDDVKALEFGILLGHCGQIPAQRRGTTARASSTPRRARMRPMVRTEGSANSPRVVNSRKIAAAPNSPRSLWSFNAYRTCSTSPSKDSAVRRVRCGRDECSRQSTRSRRRPCARFTQRCTVGRLT
jgi:hypothetical protein